MSKLKVFMFAATVNQFLGSNENPSTPDTNDLMPVILDVFAGKFPNTRVLSGTVAARANMVVGEAYKVKAVETGEVYKKDNGEEVPQYNFSVIGRPLSFEETFIAEKHYGEPQIVYVVPNKRLRDGSDGHTEGSRVITGENIDALIAKLSPEQKAEFDALGDDKTAQAEWLEANSEFIA